MSEAFATDRLETAVALGNSIAGADRDAARHPAARESLDVPQEYEFDHVELTKRRSSAKVGELGPVETKIDRVGPFSALGPVGEPSSAPNNVVFVSQRNIPGASGGRALT